jgi:hypothetical protein
LHKVHSYLEKNTMTHSLLSSEYDASNFVGDYISELKRVSNFFSQRVTHIEAELQHLKAKYEAKLRSDQEREKNNSVVIYNQQMRLGEEKDEFEYAISWKRAFAHIYLKVTWINSFALTNQIAALT